MFREGQDPLKMDVEIGDYGRTDRECEFLVGGEFDEPRFRETSGTRAVLVPTNLAPGSRVP
jgi:hypothetical protein